MRVSICAQLHRFVSDKRYACRPVVKCACFERAELMGMKLTLTQRVEVPGQGDPVAAYEARCLCNDAFQVKTHTALGGGAEVLSATHDGAKYTRSMRMAPKVEVPRMLRGVVGATLAYEQTDTYDPQTRQGTVATQLLDAGLRDKVAVEGTFSLRRGGVGSPRAVYMESDVDIRCGMRMVGGAVERLIAHNIRSGSDAIQELAVAELQADA